MKFTVNAVIKHSMHKHLSPKIYLINTSEDLEQDCFLWRFRQRYNGDHGIHRYAALCSGSHKHSKARHASTAADVVSTMWLRLWLTSWFHAVDDDKEKNRRTVEGQRRKDQRLRQFPILERQQEQWIDRSRWWSSVWLGDMCSWINCCRYHIDPRRRLSRK